MKGTGATINDGWVPFFSLRVLVLFMPPVLVCFCFFFVHVKMSPVKNTIVKHHNNSLARCIKTSHFIDECAGAALNVTEPFFIHV